MERPNNVTEGLVWLADQINQPDVEFTPRFVVHNKNEHRIYFYSDKASYLFPIPRLSGPMGPICPLRVQGAPDVSLFPRTGN